MTYDEMRGLVKSKLSEKRYIHSKNVAEEAVFLARKYGADVKKAEIAGILHDIMKESEPGIQLKIIEKAGYELSPFQLKEKKLWHSISGAAYIKTELLIDDEDILNAVRYHTTGRAGMSLLEKVIFIADFTGAERSYRGVKTMRKKSRVSLESAMLYGVSFSIGDLIKRGKLINDDTLNVYNQLIWEGFN